VPNLKEVPVAPKAKILIPTIFLALIFLGWQLKTKTPSPATPPQIQTITGQSYDQLASRPDVFVLDVHVPEQKHLPYTNAFIPYNQLPQNLDKLPQDKNTPILVYCRSGSMSALAARELTKLGYTQIYDLEGGVKAYRETHTAVTLSPSTHDFGRVRYGDIPTTEFTLTNNTPSPLTITRLSTSCSCTQAKINKTQLQPHETAQIRVSFNPAIHKDDTDLGNLTRTIYIETDNPNFPQLTARIKAFVYK
jgi:rhodanese-related sulfurtransferase